MLGRTCIEAMGAALGHTQSLHTNALDGDNRPFYHFSPRIARNTQIYIQETMVPSSVDPGPVPTMWRASPTRCPPRMGTHPGDRKLGGMAKAIETGLPKLRIEEAARAQARIDSGRQTIVGISKYRLDHGSPLDILEIDNTERCAASRSNASTR